MSARRSIRTKNQRFDRRRNRYPLRSQHKGGHYSRRTDCWNCGRTDHLKDRCPFPSSLKCSFCLKKNVRSDQCSCRNTRRNTRDKPSSSQRYQTKIETFILVKICGTTVRARLDTSVQETMVCKEIAKLVHEKTGSEYRKKILRCSGNLKLRKFLNMEMYTRSNLQVTIEGIIDDTLSEKIVVLGMRAIDEFGFKFFVGGQEAKVRSTKFTATVEGKERKGPCIDKRQPYCQRRDERSRREDEKQYERRSNRELDQDHNDRQDDYDDDRMSFLDEKEERLIREMQ